MTKYNDKTGTIPGVHLLLAKINGRVPAEADMERYFRMTPPSVNQMVLALETRGLIERTPGMGRSIRLLISREELPDLE